MRFLYILLLCNFLFMQNTMIGVPKSFTQSTSSIIESIIMPEIDIDALLLEDSQTPSGKNIENLSLLGISTILLSEFSLGYQLKL